MAPYFRIVAGVLLVLIGVIGVVMPLLPGLPFMVAGGALLAPNHRLTRALTRRMHAWLGRARALARRGARS